jgi:lysozyme
LLKALRNASKKGQKMKTSDRAIEQIANWEGFKAKAYLCPASVWTIGWGHTAGVKEGDTVTPEEELELLKKDLEEHEFYVSKHFKAVELTQSQFDAAVSFSFNAGPGNMRKSQWARLLLGGKVEAAAEAMANWGVKQFKAMPGLKKRRFIESLWLKGAIK